MKSKPRVICTVTNDLCYDQRMQRICTSLVKAGWEVWLVGRQNTFSPQLPSMPYKQVRLRCWFHKGFLFYAEFNLRLFFFLLRSAFHTINTVDLDTMPAGALAGLLKGAKGVFDAHEYFTEVPEVVHRPFVRGFWTLVEQLFMPFYQNAYTVGPALAALFTQKHGIPFGVVRNVPFSQPAMVHLKKSDPKLLLYQGALNEGRGIEAMIDSMAFLPVHFKLLIAGEGDLSAQLRERAQPLGDKVHFLGYLAPSELKKVTQEAWLGLNLLENKGLSYYYSLANKFFDYIQARVPVLTMDFPEYQALNSKFEVAVLTDQLLPQQLAALILQLEQHPSRYDAMVNACGEAAKVWNWENEVQILWKFWQITD